MSEAPNSTRSRKLALLVAALSTACSTAGPVDTVQGDSQQPVVATPAQFSTAAADLITADQQLRELDSRLYDGDSLTAPDWRHFLAWQQAFDTARADQAAIEDELEKTGELTLEPGGSYSVDLESYCVYPGKARPVKGDGLRIARIHGPATQWLPEILKGQGVKKAKQGSIQFLIWALLYDVRFDELGPEEQTTLRQFYPDAATRFGNRRLENLAGSAFRGLFPGFAETADSIAELRDQVLFMRGDFRRLEEMMVPNSGRTEPIPVGWLRMDEGYLIRATSDDYTRIRVEIYVPEGDGRSPSATKSLVFRPWEWVALPVQGQRLAISSKVIRARSPSLEHDPCKQLRAWKPKKCSPMAGDDRKRILAAADPKNFPRTRYRSPPGDQAKIEEVTDCSHFVNEVMGRSGFAFQYLPTGSLACLSVFREVPEKQALPGDLILYSGHVGFLAEDGLVVSATRGGIQRRSQLDPDNPQFIPSITRLEKRAAGKGGWRFLRWSCQ